MPSLKLSNLFRRGADRQSLRDRAADLRASVGALPAASADPVFAAIAASRRTEAEMAAFAPTVEDRRMTSAERAREQAIQRDQQATRAAVWATVPVTAAGRRALVEYARFQARLMYGDTWLTEAQNDMIFGDIFLALAVAIEAETPRTP